MYAEEAMRQFVMDQYNTNFDEGSHRYRGDNTATPQRLEPFDTDVLVGSNPVAEALKGVPMDASSFPESQNVMDLRAYTSGNNPFTKAGMVNRKGATVPEYRISPQDMRNRYDPAWEGNIQMPTGPTPLDRAFQRSRSK